MRRDGSKRGDEYLHYLCGLPMSEHQVWYGKGEEAHQKYYKLICPDELPNHYRDEDRPTGRPAWEDGL